MPSDVPITASSVVCVDGFISRRDNRETRPFFSLRLGAGGLGLFPWVGWDSKSVSLEVSMTDFSEDMELASGADNTGKASRCGL